MFVQCINRDNQIINILKNTPWLCSVHFSTLVSGSDRQSTHEWNNCFIKTSGYYNWILTNFILNITKRPDINVTSGKPRGNHMTCDLVEWKIWKGRTLYLSYSLDKYCFRFPSLWLWNSTLDRSTWLPFTQENGVVDVNVVNRHQSHWTR